MSGMKIELQTHLHHRAKKCWTMRSHIHRANRLICEVKQASPNLIPLLDVLTEGQTGRCVCARCGGCSEELSVCKREKLIKREARVGWTGGGGISFIKFHQHLFQTLISLHYQSRFRVEEWRKSRNKLLSSSTEHSLWMAETGTPLPLIKSPPVVFKSIKCN